MKTTSGNQPLCRQKVGGCPTCPTYQVILSSKGCFIPRHGGLDGCHGLIQLQGVSTASTTAHESSSCNTKPKDSMPTCLGASQLPAFPCWHKVHLGGRLRHSPCQGCFAIASCSSAIKIDSDTACWLLAWTHGLLQTPAHLVNVSCWHIYLEADCAPAVCGV